MRLSPAIEAAEIAKLSPAELRNMLDTLMEGNRHERGSRSPADSLSRGMKLKLMLAVAMSHGARLLKAEL